MRNLGRIIGILALAIAAGTARGETVLTGSIVVDATVLDLGSVQRRTPLNAVFRVKNTGADTLTISDARYTPPGGGEECAAIVEAAGAPAAVLAYDRQ